MGLDAQTLEKQAQGISDMKKIILFIIGFLVLLLGMTLILRNWEAAQIVFKGIVPSALAVAGLVMMFAASLKK